MKRSSKTRSAATKNRTKGAQAKLRQSTTKPLVLALAVRMLKAGTKRPDTTRPPAKPIARIKGNSVPGGKGAVYCGVVGDMADRAVDAMEDAIEQNDEAALQQAIADFEAAWDHGHSNGCYFTYV